VEEKVEAVKEEENWEKMLNNPYELIERKSKKD
jgi:hypothetical protein